MSLKSSEINKMFLKYQYSTDISFSLLLLLTSILSNDHPTNKLFVEIDLKKILDPPELNCSVVFSLYCLRVSKKIDHFLRNLVRRERRFSRFNVNPLSFIGMMLGTSTCSLLCGFAFDLASKTFTIDCDACSPGRSAGTSVLL